MRGLKISTGILLLIVAAFDNVSAVLTMNETCQLMSSGFIADPTSCQGYGYCNNGMLVGTGKCPDGYLYNSKIGQCDIPENVHCISDLSNVCLEAPDNSFVANPTNCNGYCYCNKKKIVDCTTCPQYQVYNSKLTRCVYASDGPKCIADSKCRLVPNGVFLNDPDNCGQYIGCLMGEERPGKCPDNTYFNYKIGACQSTNPCDTSSTEESGDGDGVGLGVKNKLPDNSKACSDVQGATNEKPEYIADGQTCMGYYICTSAQGPGTWAKCPKGLHFNAGQCVTPYTFPCRYDRCGNLNRTFVGAVDYDCKNYLICKDETSQGKSDDYTDYIGKPCKTGYFNEYSATCGQTSPKSTTYKLC